MASEEKLPFSNEVNQLQHSASSQNVPHTSRGINMNIENYQAQRRAKLQKYNSLLGSLDNLNDANSISNNTLLNFQTFNSNSGAFNSME